MRGASNAPHAAASPSDVRRGSAPPASEARHGAEPPVRAMPYNLRGAFDGDAEFFEFAVEGGTGEAEDLSASSDVP